MICKIKRIAAWLVMSVMVLCLAAGCSASGTTQESKTTAAQTVQAAAETELKQADAGAAAETELEQAGAESDTKLDEHGAYTTKDEVARYLHTYGRLPDNYITKKEAQKLGWDSKKGNLTEIAPGKSIGGSHFGNYEGQLPEKDGRKYYECDLEYDGGYRGAERLIYSNDGLIFYTGDHYKTFEQLY